MCREEHTQKRLHCYAANSDAATGLGGYKINVCASHCHVSGYLQHITERRMIEIAATCLMCCLLLGPSLCRFPCLHRLFLSLKNSSMNARHTNRRININSRSIISSWVWSRISHCWLRNERGLVFIFISCLLF